MLFIVTSLVSHSLDSYKEYSYILLTMPKSIYIAKIANDVKREENSPVN